MKPYFLVLARDEKDVDGKIEELNRGGFPYTIVCGKKIDRPGVIYREPIGKYDAINFAFRFVPVDSDVVALNDVDTEIRNIEYALRLIDSKDVCLVFAGVHVKGGPQGLFYQILDPIRRIVPIAASGELMLVRREVLEKIVPIKPCKAEDSYILFKVSEFKKRALFCEQSYVITERTKTARGEEMYKRKTVCGLYQALSYTMPSKSVRMFYILLPFVSPLLLILGKRGYSWTKGILLGLTDFLRGDRSGTWQPSYMK